VETTNRFFSGFAATRARLAMLAATFVAAMVGVVAPALASLQAVSVSAQSGTLTTGTAGSATFTVTVTRSSGTPNTTTMSISGLPAGATGSFGTQSAWSPSSGTGSRTVPLTVNVTAAVAAGSYNFIVQASGTGPDPTGTGTLTVTAPQPQTITFGILANKIYGDSFTVAAEASSGLPVSFAAAGNCSVAGFLVTTTGAGSCTITASQAGGSGYLPAPDVQQTFTIAKADQAITFNALADKFVGDAAFTVSATSTSSLPVSFAATAGDCTVTGNTVTLSTPATLPGTCTITASQVGDVNFNAATPVPQTFAINAFTGTELYAVSGSATLPGGSVTVWGYNSTGAPATQPGGDPIIVNQGDTVVIRLHNQLAQATGLLFQGQAMVPDTVGVGPLGTKTYTFTASLPGTFLYEAGLLHNAEHQVAMGLHGALIVRPATAGQAYDSATTAYTKEAVLVLSEIDPALNNATDPAAFDMRNFAPRYFLINGKVYPNTAAIPAVPGDKVLLRYVNAGAQHHSMAVLGLRQAFVAKDASLLPTGAQSVAAETLAAGQTGDAIATVPATAADGSKFAVYDGSLKLYNNGDGSSFGGMLTFVAVAGTGGGTDTAGPATTNVAFAAGNLTATVSDAATGGATIAGAEYYLDSTASTGTPMTAADGTFNAVSEGVTAAVTVPSGPHTLYVRGQDSLGNWGPFSAVAVNGGDATGPTSSGLTLTPNPSNGTVAVALHGTGNDTATGGSNIVAAEYFKGVAACTDSTCTAGTGTAMTVNAAAPVASLDATISPPVSGGVVSVHVRDAAGNWGPFATITLNVVGTGPSTTVDKVEKSPNNGTVPLNSSQPVVRVTATMSSTGSTVAGAEGFFCIAADPCVAGATGSGFPFVPSDGNWNGATETGYADIPLTTVTSMAEGTHTIYVHGRDAAGNWGATSGGTLVIDKTAPTISSATLTPSTIAFGTASVTLNVTASDANGIVGGQYWIDGSATPPATPTAFTGTSVAISTIALAGGSHTVYVRVQDGATNWSAVSSAPLTVVQAVDDARTISANTSATQTSDANAANGVLTNDQPTGVTGRTAALSTALVRTSGTGAGTLTLSCPGSLGTAATPSISGQTICANGAYRVTLTGVGNNNNQRAASKRGTFQFTYTEKLNGVTSTATVVITVN
jgi:hypothetical protein